MTFTYKDMDSFREYCLGVMNDLDSQRRRLNGLVQDYENRKHPYVNANDRLKIESDVRAWGGVVSLRTAIASAGVEIARLHQTVESTIGEDEAWKVQYFAGAGYRRVEVKV